MKWLGIAASLPAPLLIVTAATHAVAWLITFAASAVLQTAGGLLSSREGAPFTVASILPR
jgi:hypothetical protein